MVNDAGAWSREGREWAASSRVRQKRVNKSRPVLGGFPICNRLAIDQNVRPFCKISLNFSKRKTTENALFSVVLVRVLRFELRAS